MALAHYLKIYPSPSDPQQVLVYSTRRAALLLLPRTALAAAETDTLPAEAAGILRRAQVVVDDGAVERQDVWRMNEELNRVSTGLVVSVVLGMACNFACAYCYEGGLKGGQAMDDAVADQLVAYLKGRYVAESRNRLTIDFYGGETLLYAERIKALAGALKPFVEARGGSFEFTVVTNGSLLTTALVAELLPLGLRSAKVTIDGPVDIHDRCRPFRGGAGSFAVILANLVACAELLRINIGGNFTRENHHRFPELLDHLGAVGLTPERLGVVKFDAVMQVNDAVAAPEFSGGCSCINEPWLAKAGVALRGEVLRRGYETPKITPARCMVEMDNSLAVHCDGTLYKCISMIGHPGYACGDLRQGFDEGCRETYCVNHWQREEKCRDCVYLPLCYGGCRYMAYQRDGHMARVDCRKEYLDATLEAMLRQDLKYRYGQG